MLHQNQGQGWVLFLLLLAVSSAVAAVSFLAPVWQRYQETTLTPLSAKVRSHTAGAGRSERLAASATSPPKRESPLPSSDAGKSSRRLLKCTTDAGTVIYSDRLKPENCAGVLEQVGQDLAFNVIAAQPAQRNPRPSAVPQAASRHVVQQRSLPQVARHGTAVNNVERCAYYKGKLANVRSRMRAGYKAYQYNSLMDAEHRAKSGMAKYCK